MSEQGAALERRGHIRLRWSIGVLMLVVVVAAITFAFVRPLGRSAIVAYASRLLVLYDATIDPSTAQSVDIVQATDGEYWMVTFHWPDHDRLVTVPNRVVEQSRFGSPPIPDDVFSKVPGGSSSP